MGSPWLILSAKYGLVVPEKRIALYEQTLYTMRKAERQAWADNVLTDLRPGLAVIDRVVFLAGKRYREFLMDGVRAAGRTVECPLAHLGIGKQNGSDDIWRE